MVAATGGAPGMELVETRVQNHTRKRTLGHGQTDALQCRHQGRGEFKASLPDPSTLSIHKHAMSDRLKIAKVIVKCHI
jgi:hypothetical protein